MRNIYLSQVKSIEYEASGLGYIVFNVGSLCARELISHKRCIGKALLRFKQGGLIYRAKVFIIKVVFKTGGAEIEATEDIQKWQNALNIKYKERRM